MVLTLKNENLEKYGIFIKKPEALCTDGGSYHSYWHKTNMEFFNDKKLTMGYLNIERHERVLRELECHPNFAEIFVTVNGSGVIALSQTGETDDIQFFRMEKGDALLIYPVVWHKLPVPDGDRIGFLMLVPEMILSDIVKREVNPVVTIPE